jgi:hypothetical protein
MIGAKLRQFVAFSASLCRARTNEWRISHEHDLQGAHLPANSAHRLLARLLRDPRIRRIVMAQLLLGSRQGSTGKDQFDLACTTELRRLSREVDGVVFAAALETLTGIVLHSINRATDVDVGELSAAVCRLIRRYQYALATAQFASPNLDLMLTTRREFHILRPLRREPQAALYLAVQRGAGRAAQARTALSDAAFALDAPSGPA